jgi:hypothetical protein
LEQSAYPQSKRIRFAFSLWFFAFYLLFICCQADDGADIVREMLHILMDGKKIRDPSNPLIEAFEDTVEDVADVGDTEAKIATAQQNFENNIIVRSIIFARIGLLFICLFVYLRAPARLSPS